MSLRLSLLALLFVLFSAVSAQSANGNNTQLLSELAQLPQCAVSCATLLPSTSCSLTDLNCICNAGNPTNTTSAAEQCVLQNCTSREILQVQRILQSICEVPVRDVGGTVIAVTSTFAAVAFISCAIRLGVRARSWALLGTDDIFIFMAVIASAGLLACTVIEVKYGLGRDLWGVQYTNIYQLFFWIYITEILYVCSTYCTKLSILCFYLRVFTEPKFFWKTYVLLGITAAAGTGMLFVSIFQCVPISYGWTQWDKQHTGYCLPVQNVIYANAIINISLDCLIIALPIPTLLALTLPMRRKLGLLFIFCLGGFTTIVSGLRLQALLHIYVDTMDFSYQLRVPAYWSLIEIYVGITCVCLPAIRPFLRVVKHAIFGDPARKGYSYDDVNFSGRSQQGKTGPSGALVTQTKVNESRTNSTDEMFELQKA